MSLKELAIRDYISKIDFKKDDWKISKIKEDMRVFLGEEPGIEVSYKKDVMVNEFTGESKEISEVNTVKIVFMDVDDKFKKIELIIDNNL
jgi:hypothetical protein